MSELLAVLVLLLLRGKVLATAVLAALLGLVVSSLHVVIALVLFDEVIFAACLAHGIADHLLAVVATCLYEVL